MSRSDLAFLKMLIQDVTASGWITALPVRAAASAIAQSSVFLGAVVAVAAALEWRGRGGRARYLSRGFLNDMAYALFYRGGFYRVLVFSVMAGVVDERLGFLRFGLMAEAPIAARLAVFWILGDFILYWGHRWQHSSRVLWAFHSVHHTQERLTTLTQYRRHPLDQVFLEFWGYLVFPVILGLPPGTWLPLYLVTTTLQALQHAELNWRFGRLYTLVVSPVFHSFHHSADPHYHNRNFGFLLSVWDHLFDTVAAADRRPSSYGVRGLTMPETLTGQLFSPFRQLWSARRTEVSGPDSDSDPDESI